MSRLQLALRVSDVDAAVTYYEQVFATPVNKRRPGYANFAIADPPLKLVLIEGAEGAGGLDHLGVEAMDNDELVAFDQRLGDAGLTARELASTDCCYAVQDKLWTSDPDGLAWEVYVVTDDAGTSLDPVVPSDAQAVGCC